jgi:hypothetical protein
MALKTKFLPMQEIAGYVKNSGFQGENAAIAIAVIWAESGGNAWAVNVNSAPGKPYDGSLDLGICQWNTYWFPTVTPAKAFNPQYSTDLMFLASKGVNFNYWNAFVNGYHKKYMDYARACAIQAGVII